MLDHKTIALIVYLVLIGLTWFAFQKVPQGFVPSQDKQYLVGFAQLPDGASLDRTEDVIRRMSEIAMKTPGVKDAVGFPGLSIAGFTNAPNAGIVFFGLDEFEKRKSPQLSGGAIAGEINQRLGEYRGRLHRRVPAAARQRPRARSGASSCRSRIAPGWATRRSTTP